MPTVFLEHSVFLHIPKTGGEWIGDVLVAGSAPAFCAASGPYGHIELKQFDKLFTSPEAVEEIARKASDVQWKTQQKRLQDRLRSYHSRSETFLFTFVRHPVSWWKSYWRYRMIVGWNPTHPIDREARDDSFERFIEKILDHQPGWCSHIFESFTGLPDDEVNFVGRYENLQSDLTQALQLAGEIFDAGVLGSTPPYNVSIDSFPEEATSLSAPLVSRLEEAESSAIERFYANRGE